MNTVRSHFGPVHGLTLCLLLGVPTPVHRSLDADDQHEIIIRSRDYAQRVLLGPTSGVHGLTRNQRKLPAPFVDAQTLTVRPLQSYGYYALGHPGAGSVSGASRRFAGRDSGTAEPRERGAPTTQCPAPNPKGQQEGRLGALPSYRRGPVGNPRSASTGRARVATDPDDCVSATLELGPATACRYQVSSLPPGVRLGSMELDVVLTNGNYRAFGGPSDTSCADGYWYVSEQDSAGLPTQIDLCGTTCERLLSEPDVSTVNLAFFCPLIA